MNQNAAAAMLFGLTLALAAARAVSARPAAVPCVMRSPRSGRRSRPCSTTAARRVSSWP